MLISCWLLLQAAHEVGHVLAALTLGGSVDRVVLHPLEFSRTDRSGSASPLVDTWAGPVVGCVIPALCMLLARTAAVSKGLGDHARTYARTYARLFLGLCLVANGVYLAAGWSEPRCDAGELRALGVPVALLIASGSALSGLGLWALAPMGEAFGYRGEPIGRSRAAVASVFAAILIGVGFAVGSR